MSRRKLLVVFALICGAAVCWWFLRPSTDCVNFPPSAGGPWVAFGDSLTEGFGATEGNDYPAVLGRKLGVTIQNLGKSGETSSDALERVEEVAALEPRVVLLCFGGNDSLNQASRKQTFANLGRIIDRLQQSGSFVVLIGIRSASLRDQNEEHFATLAREKRVLYIPDMLRGLAFKPVYMSDAIHPNDAGYQKIAERIEKKLRPLVSKLRFPSKQSAWNPHASVVVTMACDALRFLNNCAHGEKGIEQIRGLSAAEPARDRQGYFGGGPY